jgi:hypothetical protein
MEVKVDKKLIEYHWTRWHDKNPTVLHPLTNFLETLGLKYMRLYRDDAWVCYVIDEQKFMLAKIKYGI